MRTWCIKVLGGFLTLMMVNWPSQYGGMTMICWWLFAYSCLMMISMNMLSLINLCVIQVNWEKPYSICWTFGVSWIKAIFHFSLCKSRVSVAVFFLKALQSYFWLSPVLSEPSTESISLGQMLPFVLVAHNLTVLFGLLSFAFNQCCL